MTTNTHTVYFVSESTAITAETLGSSLNKCQSEVRQALKLFNRYNLEILDTTSSSIEELAAKIIRVRDLEPNHSTLQRGKS